MTYPSGREVKNTFVSNGDLSLVETKPLGGSFTTRASNFVYSAHGAVTSMQLGNGSFESAQFNSRLQPTQIALGTTANGTDKLKLDYTYGGTNNNGNVLSQTITVPGLAQPFVQTYGYDELNRLSSATEQVEHNFFHVPECPFGMTKCKIYDPHVVSYDQNGISYDQTTSRYDPRVHFMTAIHDQTHFI